MTIIVAEHDGNVSICHPRLLRHPAPEVIAGEAEQWRDRWDRFGG